MTCTVVSVMPYMFTSRGPSVAEALEPRAKRGRLERLAAEDDEPQRERRRRLATSSSCALHEELGVAFSTVTRSSTSSSASACGERVVQSGATTSRPPWSSAPQSSQTEKSNAYEWKRSHVSSAPKPNQSSVAVKSRATFRCSTCTPFGWPVEPEV